MPKKILLFFLFFTISIHTKAEESIMLFGAEKIGRASCRERVCESV